MDAQELLSRYAAGERNFSGVNLKGVNLRDADLRKTDLRVSRMEQVNLRDAN